jgi:UDP-2,3-diacylglucosamine pyrophosphatase LpxH
MDYHSVHHTLCNLYNSAPVIKLTNQDRYIIFSDLHIGTKGKRDDFKKNSSLLLSALENYYLKNNYTLILNGDIEELLKFKLEKIQQKWAKVFDLFCAFRDDGRLIKILGNHDSDLIYEKKYTFNNELLEAVNFDYNGNSIFLFHGHQALHLHEKYHEIITLALRYLARPLNIKNLSPAYNSKRQFRIEKKVYQFSNNNKIASIIGHTHRPLFESLSKIDSIKFTIENLIREYQMAETVRQKQIKIDIKDLTAELLQTFKKNKKLGLRSSPYDALNIVPCMFNSGCCIGKRGITGIEIKDGRVSLVYWYGKKRYKKYLRFYEEEPVQLYNTNYFKIVLKSDELNSIFNRITLLSNTDSKSLKCSP